MKGKLSTAGKAFASLLIAAAIAGALRKCWPSISGLAATCDYRWLWMAALAGLVYRVLNAAGWGLVLRSLGPRLPLFTGIRLWLVAETMRWLPGSIWGYYSRIHQAQRAGVPTVPATLSMPLELLITVLAWTASAVAGGIGLSQVLVLALPQGLPSALWPISAGLAALATCGGALLLRWRKSRLSRKARGLWCDLGGIVRARPRALPLAGALALFLGLCVFNGLAFFAVLRALTPHPPTLGAAIGINAVGWLIGFFAIFSPGGLGVREAGMTALLVPLVPLEIAVGSVVLWRVLQIIAEILCLGACYVPSVTSRWSGHSSTPLPISSS